MKRKLKSGQEREVGGVRKQSEEMQKPNGQNQTNQSQSQSQNVKEVDSFLSLVHRYVDRFT